MKKHKERLKIMALRPLFSAIHSITKKAIIEKMKGNCVASGSRDDHSSQWEFSKKENYSSEKLSGPCPVSTSRPTD